jgi:hypothetical protein
MTSEPLFSVSNKTFFGENLVIQNITGSTSYIVDIRVVSI